MKTCQKCHFKSNLQDANFCTNCGAPLLTRKQELLWIPKGRDVGGSSLKCDPIPFNKPKPDYVWTLFVGDENSKPELPIVPRHQINAFIEDYLHDWNIHDDKFYYYSRVSEGGVWVLLEYNDNKDSESDKPPKFNLGV